MRGRIIDRDASPFIETRLDDRYNPDDYTPEEARTRFGRIHDADPAAKSKALRDIFKKFHPVFRRFFEEHFSDPQEWFERKQAYTKSVATMAIVGWIVGELESHSFKRRDLTLRRAKASVIVTSTTC